VKSQRKELEKLGNELLKKARAGEISATSVKAAFRAATTKKASSSSKKKTSAKKTTAKKTTKKKR
jgi:hypothetical protein